MNVPGMGFVNNLLNNGVKQTVADKIDETTRAVLAGVGVREARALLRGDPPTEKPNPRYRAQVKSFMLHIRPKFYQEGSTWLTHTFRLGMLSTLLFGIETVTGLILMVFYTPAPEIAYYDMLNILSNVNFGKYLRDLHRLGAELMVIIVTLHMVRVYFTGSYKHPRQFTWLTGVVLLLLTLFLSFSGYLLPWDQLAFWAVTIGTSMAEAAPMVGYQTNLLLRGSQDIGAGGLLRFYLMHVLLLPLGAAIFLSVHYYKVSREHSISLPAVIEEGEASPAEVAAAKKKIDLLPDLFTTELMWIVLFTTATFVATAFFYTAKLENHANPLVTPLHTTAPWYFLWLQGMLKLGDKQLWGVIVPTIIFLVLFAVPYLDPGPSRLAKNRKIGITVGIVTTILILVLSFMGTGLWGVSAPPAIETIQEFIPQEGVGPVKEVPYEELFVGVYDTHDPEAWPEGELGHVVEELEEAIHRETENPSNNFYDGQVVLSVESWSPVVKKVTMEVFWQEVPEGDTTGQLVDNSTKKEIFIHEDSDYTLLE